MCICNVSKEFQGLNLKRTLEIASQCEKIETQLAVLSVKWKESESINRVNGKSNNLNISTRGKLQEKDKTYYRCGFIGHFGRDTQCPAKGKRQDKTADSELTTVQIGGSVNHRLPLQTKSSTRMHQIGHYK